MYNTQNIPNLGNMSSIGKVAIRKCLIFQIFCLFVAAKDCIFIWDSLVVFCFIIHNTRIARVADKVTIMLRDSGIPQWLELLTSKILV